MNAIRRIIVGVAGIVVAALALQLAAPKAIQAVAPTPVTVTNTPNVVVANTPKVTVANTVPVAGSVTVTNTVPVTGRVAVSSLPAVQLGGSVSADVSNPTASNGYPQALITEPTEGAFRVPVQSSCVSNAGELGNISCRMYVVPATERLVIEFVDVSCNFATKDAPYFVALRNTTASTELTHVLVATSQATTYSATDQSLRLYAAQGTDVTLIVNAGPTAQCVGNISGYLEPADIK